MRHREAPNHAALLAARSAQEAGRKKPRSVQGIGVEKFVEALDEVKAMLAAGGWTDARGLHFVALYADLHYRVYGVEDHALGPKERVYAAKLASDMLAKDFASNRDDFAKFVAWTWTREKEREEYRRANHKTGGTMTWRAQFSRSVLTAYRIEQARRGANQAVAR